jgi:uncharacterized membrane protein YgdD (TMEM256/DUF423 family)
LKNYWILIGGIFGFLGVALGAFGAHGLKNTLTPEMLEIFRTGVLYQLIHTAAILAVGLSGNKKLFKAALFFSIGIILFSFSLYLYTITGITQLAMITPFGGVSFLIGWLLVIVSGISYLKNGLP